ncbi:hypothetical protein N7451_003149 [Penicillium sp. IBT 35674x]|nr:hypothetical protein N7451_003149 [Penicillium sp. IBT 35674x]
MNQQFKPQSDSIKKRQNSEKLRQQGTHPDQINKQANNTEKDDANIGDTSMAEHKTKDKDQCCDKVTSLHDSKIANKLDPRVDSNQPTTAQRASETRMPGWMVA